MQFNGFQAARAGLKKHAPQLASSGTGGSYFIANEQAGHPLQLLNNPLQYPFALSSTLASRHCGLFRRNDSNAA